MGDERPLVPIFTDGCALLHSEKGVYSSGEAVYGLGMSRTGAPTAETFRGLAAAELDRRAEGIAKMATLIRAIEIATKAHAEQVDKAGEPYILHPLRLMLRMATEAERITAVLHDVVEDSGFTLDDLIAEGFAREIVHAVDALSKREGEDYMQFVRRASEDPIARRVKRADLEDNLNLTRIRKLTDRDLERVLRYHRALEILAEWEPQ